MAIRHQSLSIDGPVDPPSFLAATVARERFLTHEFRHSYGWLTGCMQRLVGSSSDAEDLASSAFTELAAHPDVATIRQPRALLTTIARRLTFEFWRRRDIERAYLSMLAQAPERVTPPPEVALEAVQEIVLIDAALQQLSARAREAFIMSQFEDMKYAEIAERLGVSVSMVRKYVAQALALCCGAA
ncbi:sigma-70 family RNA polymerase sigma factor [Paraburkholderia caballeronis]|uniref:RNA polymerase sigma-70 factor, ECF subfamily n=1 Tax=Paraburkholderia caballeronis TaxID=416943 RepID=A0A1H7LWD7_9BURK|nr:sigma-70 family RNA polymerase sigma factor [Paraburkholderia caballeronis]PXW28622.1 RNA polymerase sigma-70 factor (ECF subfamily) [Paraburkholderia caballeronis]PXX03988.1 RNA polymerase sigma-70 factor (ECF subfamily) [Paraburkholderia caballeronis]RAK04732.1 RNA polymerase sigma-70 factor (ECF subfamily) [Paraburkholderia caballeronis]TDV19633.1 RNA polymerase sigma-70 factor (ECF subfamily) [Paraburkholderia caballeronis]TDV22232.1 RNA polymerase sigma-70 factor (ECF subfamily) [Parab